MKHLDHIAVTLLLGCAIPESRGSPLPIPLWVDSHNRAAVDVYLLCGNRDAEWLGVVPPNEAAAFEIPAERTRCVHGLNFFLVRQDLNRGYWVGPLSPRSGLAIDLTIEKYAGLSSARLLDDSR
jgi:hypothetical protein